MNNFSFALKFLVVSALVSFFCAVFFVSFDFFSTREHFPPNSFIGKVEVSGLDKKGAELKLKKTPLILSFEPMVYFNASGETFTYTPEEVGIHVKEEESVKNAFALSHKESYIKDLQKRLTKEALLFPILLDANDAILRVTLEDIATRVESVAQDANIVFEEKTGAYSITEDFPGRKLDIEASIKECKGRLANSKNVFPLVLDYYETPRITEYMLRSAPPVNKISEFITYYGSHDSPNRIHNISLIASWLDNLILLPDEEFSLVKAIGRFTPDRGFRQAYVIVGGVLEPQYGGGTCQIGTTFYNAAALADLEIISRRNHSLYFNIYPLGRDATVYPGSADFKFRNNTGHAILIKTQATKKHLRFALYGTPTGKKVVFSEPEIFSFTQNGVKKATKWQVLRGGGSFRTVVARKVFDQEGKLIKEEAIKSFYKLYGDGTNVKIIRREGQ